MNEPNMRPSLYDAAAMAVAFGFTGYPVDFPVLPATAKSLGQRKPVHGIGINDAPYQIKPRVNGRLIRCPAYTMWASMLERAYCPKFKARNPAYAGVTVCREWWSFMEFRRWLLEQPGWQDRVVEKDLLLHGNTVYAPSVCVLVPPAINQLFVCQQSANGLPVGVYRNGKRYSAGLSINGKREHLGTFDTAALAGAAYRSAKLTYAVRAALPFNSEPVLYAAIIDNAYRCYCPESA